MAHYAILDENNIVINVIVGKDEGGDTDWENYYGNVTGKTVKRTSYNTRANNHSGGGTPFRKNYAGIGYTYDATRDAFYEPKPYSSWTLNETTCIWEAPVSKPTNNEITYTDETSTTQHYERLRWDEENQRWLGVNHKKYEYAWDPDTSTWTLL